MFSPRRAGGPAGPGPAGRAVAAPPVHGSQVCRHVVLPVELFMTNFARVGVPLQMGGYIVPVEVARVGVGVVADLTAVRVLGRSLIRAEAADADGIGSLGRAKTAGVVGVEVGKFWFDLLLHLEVHQVGRGARGARLGLGVHAQAGAGQGQSALVWRFWEWLDEVWKVISFRVPEHFGLSRVVSGRAEWEVILLLLDCLHLLRLDAFSRVSAVSVWLLHWEIQDGRSLVRKVVVVGRWKQRGRGGASGLTLEWLSPAVPQARTDVKSLLWN